MFWRSFLRAVKLKPRLSVNPFRRHLETSVSRPANFTPFGKSKFYDAEEIAMGKQFKITQARGKKRRKLDPVKEAAKDAWPDGKHDDVLRHEVRRLLKQPKRVPAQSNGEAKEPSVSDDDPKSRSEGWHEVEFEIEELSSTGDGLARSTDQDHVYIIPYAIPGERVLARVPSYSKALSPEGDRLAAPWSDGDLVKVLEPSPKREGVTPACKYFGTCSGCQLQMLSYDEQLSHKKTVVEKAYKNFSGLDKAQIPDVAETGPSPLQYGYRTKLTPHFDGPPGPWRKKEPYKSVPPIGFTLKGRKKVMDIESCPIATDIVQEGLKRERASVAANILTYKNGATILLRETTERVYDKDNANVDTTKPTDSLTPLPPPTSKSLTYTSEGRPQLHLTYPSLSITDIESYTRDERSESTEYVGDYKFTTRAGSFFQNNNSILPSFLSFIREHALPKPSTTTSTNLPTAKYLLDAYCGAGLFALTLSPLFHSVLGIEIDASSVTHARLNATQNNVSNAGFIEADAAALFADVPYPAVETVVVIDPPRKGCSKDFLRQLLAFGPRRVVYVSCNVSSQARDVGVMVRGRFAGVDGEVDGGWRYEIEGVRGWDFFPQTGHVEGVCVLNRVERSGEREVKELRVEKEG